MEKLAVGDHNWRFRLADILFRSQLTPVFKAIECLEDAGMNKVAQDDDELAFFVEEYAAAIRRGADAQTRPSRTEETAELVRLQALAEGVQTA